MIEKLEKFEKFEKLEKFEKFEKLDLLDKQIVRICKLENETICSYDLCADYVDAYAYLNTKLIYIGKGKFHSFDGVVSTDNVIRHFWIYG